LGQENLEYQRV